MHKMMYYILYKLISDLISLEPSLFVLYYSLRLLLESIVADRLSN